MLSSAQKILLTLGLIFSLIGLGMVSVVVIHIQHHKNIIANGEKITGKLLGYVPNLSVMINGHFASNLVVRYFDENNQVSEIELDTELSYEELQKINFGYTVDIYVYDGEYTYDEESIRDEHLLNEETLLDINSIKKNKYSLEVDDDGNYSYTGDNNENDSISNDIE